MLKNCDGCDSPSTHLLVNGEEQIAYCKHCAAAECGDMVVSNDSISFRLVENADGTILIVVGAA